MHAIYAPELKKQTYPTCGYTYAAALKNTGPNSEGNAATLDLLLESYHD